MKASTSLIMRSLALTAACISVVAAMAAPVIRWDSDRHDFGAFNEDLSTVSWTFRGINAGQDTLVIFDVKPNCGCTTTDRYNGRTYAPGDSVNIRVTYNAVGRPGRFTKKIMIYSNADPVRQPLTISGIVIGASNTMRSRYPVDAGPFRVQSATAMFGEIIKGGAGSTYFKGYNHGSSPITPAVASKPDYMGVEFAPTTVYPGEQFIISTTLFSADCPEWGLVADSIVIATGDSLTTLQTVATVKEDFGSLTPKQLANAPRITVEPQMVDLGTVARSASGIKRTIKVGNSGHDPLVVRRVYCPDPAVNVKISKTKIPQGKSAEITLEINPAKSASPDMVNARITIISNSPDSPTKIVRVVGQITD